MAKGKQTCKILKEIRKQIAAENDIKLVIEECTYQGDCLGTCPKCEAEVRYLERELEKRQRMGKAAMVAGLSVGLLGTAPVAMAQTPVADTLDASETEVITEPLMGIIPMEPQLYYVELSKNPEIKKQFSISMADLGVLGFEVKDFEFDQMKKEAKAFYAPVAKGGQEKLLAFISYNLGEKATKLKGEMKLSFNVNTNGKASMVIVKKSVDPEIDFPVVDAMNAYTWESAYYVLQSGEIKRVSSDCTLTIQFPLKPATIDDLWIEEALEGDVMAPVPDTLMEYVFEPKEDEDRPGVYIVVEQMPEFPGGDTSLVQFIADNTKYPAEAKEKGIKGRVFVNFIVEPDGSVSDIKVLRGIGGGCDEEAVRVVEYMPKFKPGIQNGEAVRVSYTVPVIFKLEDKQD